VADPKDVVRSHIERIGVSRTWLEWVDRGDEVLKVLLVEVDFDADPNAASFRQEVINAITDDVLQHGILSPQVSC
jgi:hypothetical protein